MGKEYFKLSVNNEEKVCFMDDDLVIGKGDVFGEALLRTLNSVYEKFQIIKKQGSIYVLGYDKSTYNGDIPKEGGDLDIAYPEKDIVIVDRDCVQPFTKEHMEKTGGWKQQYEDKEWLRGHTVGCIIFADIVKSNRERGQNIA